MDPSNFSPLVHWALNHGYWIMFVVAVAEGPMLSIISGLLVHLGYFNFWLIYLVLMAGDLAGDTIWYQVGRHGVSRLINRFGHFINLHPGNVAIIERKFKKHQIKTLLISKMTNGFGFALLTLLTAGSIRIPFKKYIIVNALGQLFWTGLLLTIGYFFGQFYQTIDKGFRIASIIVFVGIIAAILYGIQRYARSVAIKDKA